MEWWVPSSPKYTWDTSVTRWPLSHGSMVGMWVWTSFTAASLQNSLWALLMSKEAFTALGLWSRSTSTALCMPSAAPLDPKLYSLSPSTSWILAVKVLVMAFEMRRLWRLPRASGRTLSCSGLSSARTLPLWMYPSDSAGIFPRATLRSNAAHCCHAMGCCGIHSQCSPRVPPGPAPLFLGA